MAGKRQLRKKAVVESKNRLRRFGLTAVMAAGIITVPFCYGITKDNLIFEIDSGALVDGEENSRYRFRVKAGDLLFKELKIDARPRGISFVQRTEIERIDAAGVAIKTSWKGYEPAGIIFRKGKIRLSGVERMTIPFKECTTWAGGGYLVRFDDVKGDAYVTMLENQNFDDMKSFTSKSKPCAP